MRFFKISYLLIFLTLTGPVLSQNEVVSSGVYLWNDIKMKKNKAGMQGILVEGSCRDFANIIVKGVILNPVKMISQKKKNDEEKLFIIRSGSLQLSTAGKTHNLGKGSVFIIMPNEDYTINNPGAEACTFYQFEYVSKLPVDLSRGSTAGGSFTCDWDKIEFRPHDRGGVRDFFNQPTAMTQRFEMHMTSLNGNIQSHEPHTHRAAEFILMREGDTEMQIGDQFFQATSGDLYFVESEVLHGIRNKKDSQCMYYAFQFE